MSFPPRRERRRGGGLLARRRARRHADRDRLRPRRRRHLRSRGGGDLRRQGTAPLQSADRPLRRRGEREREAAFDAAARRLARAFWPGPLTLVVPVAADCRVSLLARAGPRQPRVRVPSHPIARALIAAAGVPLAAPSANRSGASARPAPNMSPPTSAAASIGSLDAGRRRSASNSTIVACLGERRAAAAGRGSARAVEAELGFALRSGTAERSRAAARPGRC